MDTWDHTDAIYIPPPSVVSQAITQFITEPIKCYVNSGKSLSNSLDIDFIHGGIHGRLCVKFHYLINICTYAVSRTIYSTLQCRTNACCWPSDCWFRLWIGACFKLWLMSLWTLVQWINHLHPICWWPVCKDSLNKLVCQCDMVEKIFVYV